MTTCSKFCSTCRQHLSTESKAITYTAHGRSLRAIAEIIILLQCEVRQVKGDTFPHKHFLKKFYPEFQALDTHPFFPDFFLDSTGVGGGEGECFLFLVLAAAFLSLLSGLRTGCEGIEVVSSSQTLLQAKSFPDTSYSREAKSSNITTGNHIQLQNTSVCQAETPWIFYSHPPAAVVTYLRTVLCKQSQIHMLSRDLFDILDPSGEICPWAAWPRGWMNVFSEP